MSISLTTIADIAERDYSLNIALYIRDEMEAEPVLPVEECAEDWLIQSIALQEQMQLLVDMLPKEGE